MEEKNNKISALQFLVICSLMLNTFFAGIGIINIFIIAKQNAWIVGIISLVIGLIPLMLIIYVFNYKPDKNILEKNKILFGKIIGNILNFILFAYIFFMLIIVIHGITTFCTTMYLTKTPSIVISIVFVLTAVYAVIKGIETIGRTGEILFFMAILIVGIIVISLLTNFNFDELKPILVHGFKPLYKGIIVYLSYVFSPLIILLIIPKSNVVNNKKISAYILGGYVISFILMFFVFFIIPGVVTPALASIYRFPAYYVLRKITIGGAINNVENFLSVHWFFNAFAMIMMCIYFISEYIKGIFKIKKVKILNIVIIVIGLTAAIINNKLFLDPTSILTFMVNSFPYIVAMVLLIITIIICINIFIRKKISNKKEEKTA